MSWRKDVEDGMDWDGLIANNREDEHLKRAMQEARRQGQDDVLNDLSKELADEMKADLVKKGLR